jgi:hypothetical protein
MLGSPDIQSLSDLGNSFMIMHETKAMPFTRKSVTELLAVTIAPLLPLVLTVVPIEQLVGRLAKLLM